MRIPLLYYILQRHKDNLILRDKQMNVHTSLLAILLELQGFSMILFIKNVRYNSF